MLHTDRLIIKLLEQEDEKYIVGWRYKIEIIDKLFSNRGLTLTEHRRWFERYLSDDSRIEFVIIKTSDQKRIGTIGLSNIDRTNQKGEYGIIIGEADERGKGYAKEASQAILRFAFNELNLNKVYLHVFSDNINAIKLYTKLGFEKEGLLKEHTFKAGVYKDVVAMAALRDSWRKKYE